MDPNMNDFPESDTPFSFEQLLYGDDWQMWDTYPTVDDNPNLQHSMVEMNHGGLTIDPDPISVVYPMEETDEQWLQTTLANYGPVEMPSYEELPFTYEEFMLISELLLGDVGSGLGVDVIDGNLNRRRYEDRSGQAEKCVICLDELKYNDEASKLACGHDFHFECIKNWIMVKNECPLCKHKAL